jgi:predicted O-methyltransferase YrrM
MRDKVHPLVGRSDEILPVLAPEQFDLIFIDADHSYEGVRADIELSLPLLRPGGVLAFHDYTREERPEGEGWSGDLELGITRAVHEFFDEPDEVVGTLAVIRSPWLATVTA